MHIKHDSSQKRGGFTLIELLVSMTILTILLLLVSQIVGDVQKAWRSASSKVYQFRETRRAFDAVKRNLGMATLNPYLRYQYNNADPFIPASQSNSTPLGWVRFSELNFVTGPSEKLLKDATADTYPAHSLFFQAPIGFSTPPSIAGDNDYSSLSTGMNGRGYYVTYGDDSALIPAFLNGKDKPRVALKSRYRLMEFAPPVEANLVYDAASGRYDPAAATPDVGVAKDLPTSKWFNSVLGKDSKGSAVPLYRDSAYSHVLAENVIALIVSPTAPVPAAVAGSKKPTDIAPNYYYNSSAFSVGGASLSILPDYAFQLPPEVHIVMVVMDEISAEKLSPSVLGSDTLPPPPFKSSFDPSWFTDATKLDADLKLLVAVLVDKKVNYRIFSATVTMRNSHWSGLMQ